MYKPVICEAKGVECEVSVDGGTCLLVNFNYCFVYEEILDNLGVDFTQLDDYWFIENLRNNNVKGSGLAAFNRAVMVAKRHKKRVLVLVDPVPRLREWYLSVGCVETKLRWVLEA